MLLRGVLLEGLEVDVRASAEGIGAIGPDLTPLPGEAVVDGHGGTVIPGLHDHHVHLLAIAAARSSVRLGPPDVLDASHFSAALAEASRRLPPGAWLRGVGYHESVAGPLDRTVLDALVPDRPVRIQHRSGAEWTLNTAGAIEIGLDEVSLPGVERDPAGVPTGRLRRLDDWLASRVPRTPIDLAAVGAELARHGVTGVTDATPFSSVDGFVTLATAVRSLPQRVVVTGGPSLAAAPVPSPLVVGPVKVVLADPDLPGLDEVIAWFTTAHSAGRPVAVHCVTRAALVLALAAWSTTGARAGDRIEHGAVVPPELYGAIRRHGLTVVTQPGFIAERGDRYLAEVDPVDLPYLYPCRSLVEAGIEVGGGTDAPFGDPDPWTHIRAAVHRRTADGATLGAAERVSPSRALDLFLTRPERPGGPPRTVEIGQPADLVVLHDDAVTLTIRAGEIIFPPRS